MRDNRKADAQGLHRYARAGHAYAVAPAAQRFLLDADGVLPRT